jgi:hypothetical protein
MARIRHVSNLSAKLGTPPTSARRLLSRMIQYHGLDAKRGAA